MRLRLRLPLAVLCAVLALTLRAFAEEPTCKAYLVYNADLNKVVSAVNSGRAQPVASLTKLMTAILACERLRFDGRYILTDAERATFGVDTMRAEKMLELMLIPSNNKVCSMVARIVSGGEAEFAVEMNAKACALGMTDTRFVNASGLPQPGQQSTAADVLLLARTALSYPRIRQALCEQSVELNGESYPSTLADLYKRHPGLLGGKTGYTSAAGRCLVLDYVAQGSEYLVITLGSKSVAAGFRDAELVLARHGLYRGEIGKWE